MFMKFRFGALAMLGAAVLVSAPAAASTTTPIMSQEAYTVGQGDIQTVFNGNPFILRGDASDEVFTLNLGANYFFTDILAPGVEISVIKSGGTFFRFLPNLKAYWPGLGRVLPYGQFGIGYFHGLGADLFDMRIGFGIDYLLANNVAIGLGFQYDLGAGDGTFHQIGFPFGFNIYFKL
jgi:opacity protein-like surface antigen